MLPLLCNEQKGGFIMKWFSFLFTESYRELKKLNTLTVTGVLIALGFAFELLASRQTILQIKFSYLVIALIAMLYGPVVSALSAGILDLFSGMLSGGVWPELVLVKILAGLIFGVLLYKTKAPFNPSRDFSKTFKMFFTTKYGYIFMLKAALSKLLVNVVCNILLTTLVMQLRLGGKTFIARLSTAVPKNLIMLPVEILLMLIILVPAYNIYCTYFRKVERITKQ